jgi:hypothetical protein
MNLEYFLSLIKEYYKKIISFFIIIILITILFQYFSISMRDQNVENNVINPIAANYRSDMNFLQCLAEQHSCLYQNLRLNISQDKIIEVCKDENFCSSPISNSK